MGIFPQNGSFSNVLVVWGAEVQVLVIREDIRRMTHSLGG
jgi:hypothetical protein